MVRTCGRPRVDVRKASLKPLTSKHARHYARRASLWPLPLQSTQKSQRHEEEARGRVQDATAPCIPGWDQAWMKGLHARTLLVRFCLHARATLPCFAFLGDTRGITCAGETGRDPRKTWPKYRTYHEIQPSTCAGETKFTCACEPKTTCAREAVTGKCGILTNICQTGKAKRLKVGSLWATEVYE